MPIERLRRHAHSLTPEARALLWAVISGLIFCVLNALMRVLAQQLHPMQIQFLRYLFGFIVLLPLVARTGLAAFKPNNLAGQFWRGGVHTAGLVLWFLALTHIPLADTTAIGFTGPIFIMLGAWWFLKEPMRWERWVATAIGFAGVLIVLWQAITVTLFSVPAALWVWQAPSALQWAGFVLCGALGSAGHYCLTRSFRVADISSTQSLKFLDLVWATAMGWLLFGAVPSQWSLVGGAVICGSTVWIARHEARSRLR